MVTYRVWEEGLAELGGDVHHAIDVLVTVVIIEMHVILHILDVRSPVLVLTLLVAVTKEQVKYRVSGICINLLIKFTVFIVIIISVVIISNIQLASENLINRFSEIKLNLIRVKAVVMIRGVGAVRLTLAVTINLESCTRDDLRVSLGPMRSRDKIRQPIRSQNISSLNLPARTALRISRRIYTFIRVEPITTFKQLDAS